LSGPDLKQQMAAALLEMSDLVKPVSEAVDGYKADLERRGYSPTAAEAMAMEFHRYLFAQMLSGIKK
jgi:hypothetical protein